DLIRGEGLEVISARNVAERAGYSYATLYNYFHDIRDLIFSCVEDFLEECRVFVLNSASKAPAGKEHLIAVVSGYCNFFIQYPGIFDLLFHQKVSAITTAQSKIGKIVDFLPELTANDWCVIVGGHSSDNENSGGVQKVYVYAIHGLLLLYLNNRQVMEYSEVMLKVKELTEIAVQKY
ncbi:MAG TPA: TetR/AcrR family transcriptional regulator, partial [Chitinispirillaceae bacterium]|nr:TetR/AcrR family transcriptional regulator [Chitinispirillaceae bacterium]